MKEVEKLLAIFSLNKLLKVKHLVKENILLDETEELFGDIFRLELRSEGLVEEFVNLNDHTENMCYSVTIDRDLIDTFSLSYKTLEHIHEELTCHNSK